MGDSRKIKAIIFDMDNTLLELNVDWYGLTRDIDYEYFQGKYSHLTPHKFFVAFFSKLLDKLTKRQQKEIREKRLEKEMEGLATGTCFPYRGILKSLSKKYKLAVVSGNYRPTVIKALKRCGFRPYINAIVSIDDVPESKPSPLPLLRALKMLKVKPSQAVYIGDHPDDIKAARNAGMYAIGVLTYKRKYDQLNKESPDIIINNLFELESAINKLEFRLQNKYVR
ncbi:MAG: HAD family hydrolase [Candidatus Micrarchaeota archaeon]|nr:HAD family hydrolase [Candidatus Micrarchaeota archaeon]